MSKIISNNNSSSGTTWELLNRKKVADTRILSVFEDTYTMHRGGALPTSSTSSFVTVDTADWATILPITTDGKFVMIDQYRFGSKEISLEFPGGVIGQGEDPVATGIRELEEETGYVAGSMELISVQNPNPAFMTNTFNILLATDCTLSGQTKFDAFEDISSLKTFTYDEVVNLFRTNKITHSLMYSVFFAYLAHSHNDYL